MTDDRPVTTGTGTPAVRPRAAGLEVASLLGTVAAVVWLPFLVRPGHAPIAVLVAVALLAGASGVLVDLVAGRRRSEEHTSELQSRENLVCRLLLEKKDTSTN